MGHSLIFFYTDIYKDCQDYKLKMPKGSGLTKPLQLSTELADLVGAKKGEKLSRPEVVKRLWAHIKSQKLQDPENKQYFTPDAKMIPIFGKDKVRAFGMAKFLKTHLTNAPSPHAAPEPHQTPAAAVSAGRVPSLGS